VQSGVGDESSTSAAAGWSVFVEAEDDRFVPDLRNDSVFFFGGSQTSGNNAMWPMLTR
jgi:hypothetical protein